MIKILKHGKYYAGECECEKCGCVFKYGAKDVFTKEYAYNLTEHQLLICPECKSKIDLGWYDYHREMKARKKESEEK